MSDGEVTRFVPLTLEASEQRVTESSLEEPTTGMGIQAGKASKQPTNEYQRCEASGHDGGSLHVGQNLRPFVSLPCGGLTSDP